MNQEPLPNEINRPLMAHQWKELYKIYLHYVSLNQQPELEQRFLSKLQKFKNQFMTKSLNNQKADLFISINEINTIKNELSKQDHQKDLYTLDEIMRKNKFLSNFEKGVRIGLVESAQFLEVNKDEKIIQSNSVIDKIYIIVRGYCSLYARVQASYNEETLIQYGSFSDGEQFGEQNMIPLSITNLTNQEQFTELEKKLNKKLESKEMRIIESFVMSHETTYLLTVPIAKYKTIIFNSVEKDVDFKLIALKRVQNFRNFPSDLLLTLASAMVIHTYRLGDVIVNKGDLLEDMYIVSKGYVNMCLEHSEFRGVKNDLLQAPPKNFCFKDQIDTYSKKPSYDDVNHRLPPKPYFSRRYQDGMKIKKNIQLQLINPGGLIFSRALLNDNDYEIKCRQFPDLNKSVFKRAQLSLVTSSKESELYSINIQKFNKLPHSLQDQIKHILYKIKEYDDVNVDEIEQTNNDWAQLKQAYVQSLVNQKRNSRSFSVK